MRKQPQAKINKSAASGFITLDVLTSKTISAVSEVLFEVCAIESLEAALSFSNGSIDDLYQVGQALSDRVELNEVSELSNETGPFAASVIDLCLLALAYCGKCKVKIAEGDSETSVLAALEARFYAGRAFGLASSGLDKYTGDLIERINIELAAFRSEKSRNAALGRNATDEKRKAMVEIKKRFFAWKKENPDEWKSNAAFARDMCDVYKLESSKHIENNCTEWAKELIKIS